MKKIPTARNDESEPRRRAKVPPAVPAPAASLSEMRRMLRELQSYQIKLERQNDELKRAKEQSEKALEKYTDLYEFTPAGYLSLDADGVILEANLAGAALLGTERSRLPARRFDLFVDPSGRAAFQKFLAEIFSGGQKLTCEIALLNGRSTACWAEVHAQAAAPRDGERRWCRVAVIDATARRRSEDALGLHEARFHTLFNTIDQGFCTAEVIFDAKGRACDHLILEANLAFEKHTGLKNPVGQRASVLAPNLEREWSLIYARVAQTGKAERIEMASPALARWFDVFVSPVGGAAEHRVAIVFTDITERHRTQEALRASEGRYRTLFESMDQGYCIIEMIFDDSGKRAVDWRYLEVNPAFENQTGLRQAVGKTIVDLVPNLEPKWFEFYGRVALTGEAVRCEDQVRGLDGIWVDVYAFRFGAAESRKVGVLFTNTTVRKRAEARLQESEARYRRLFESIDEGFCVVEVIFDRRGRPVDYRFLEVNPSFGKQTGLIDPVGKRIRELSPGVEQHWMEAFGKVATTGESVRYVFNHGGVEGRWFEGYACRIEEESGRKVAIVFTNITERKRAEELLQVSEVRYRRLFEAAKDGVLLLDSASGKITDSNPFMTKLLGYGREELLGQELFEIGLLKDATASRAMVRKLKRNHQVRYDDLPLVNRSGGRQDVEVVANLYRENGHTVIQCNIRDITQRKRAAEVLSRSEALFFALMNQAPVGVFVVDGDFRLQLVNRIGRPVFKNIEPLIGRNMREIFGILWSKPVAAKVTKIFRHTLATGEPYRSPPFKERRRDSGKVEIYDWQIQRVTLPNGEYRGVCFFSNITGRVRAEAAQGRLTVVTASNEKLRKEIVRRRAVEQALQQSERSAQKLLSQSRLLQGKLRQVSHQAITAQEELRKEISRELHDEVSQLLAGVNVHLAVFTKTAAANPQHVRQRVEPLRRMVADSMRRVHVFCRELRPPSLDDLGLIPALRSYIAEFAAQPGRRITFKAFAGVEALGIDQRTVLFRVAQEALVNIRKHSGANAVGIVIRKIPDGACLEITDNGKAFDVARVSSAGWSKGLGLTGMRERVEMVGGRFGIVSVAGTGTTVRAAVPFGN